MMRRNPQPAAARRVTDQTFRHEVLGNPRLVLVDFWADWCLPCHALAPVLEKFARRHHDLVDVFKLDIDENYGTRSRYAITSIPTMLLFHQGTVVRTIHGVRNRRALEAEVASARSEIEAATAQSTS